MPRVAIYCNVIARGMEGEMKSVENILLGAIMAMLLAIFVIAVASFMLFMASTFPALAAILAISAACGAIYGFFRK